MQTAMPMTQTITEEQIQMVKNAIASVQSSKRAESERAKQIEKSRNELLARDLEARKAAAAKRPCFADRLWEKLVNAYSLAYAVIYLIAGKLVQIDED